MKTRSKNPLINDSVANRPRAQEESNREAPFRNRNGKCDASDPSDHVSVFDCSLDNPTTTGKDLAGNR